METTETEPLLKISKTEGTMEVIIIDAADSYQIDNGTIVLSALEVQKLAPYITGILNSVKRKGLNFHIEANMNELKSVICNEFNIHPTELMIKNRKKPGVIGRQLLFTILIWCNYGSLATIGKLNRNGHATVLYSKRSIMNMIYTRDIEYFHAINKVLDHFQLSEKYITKAI